MYTSYIHLHIKYHKKSSPYHFSEHPEETADFQQMNPTRYSR